MTERPRTLTIRMSDEELAQAHALADAGDESIGRLVRRWVVREFEKRFGDEKPPEPKLKPGPSYRSRRKEQ